MQGRYYLLSYNQEAKTLSGDLPTPKCSKRQSQNKTLSTLENSEPRHSVVPLNWPLCPWIFLWDAYFIFGWAWVGIPLDMEPWATFAASQVISIFLFQECLGLSPAFPFSWVGAVTEHHGWGPTHQEEVKAPHMTRWHILLGGSCDILLGLVPLL